MGSIPPVSHRRPESEFVYDSANVEKLRLLSLQRQQSSPEFNYINNNITLYEERKQRKEASLDIEKRMQLKLSDQNATENLKNIYDSLEELSFPKKKVELKVVEDQLAKSRGKRRFK